MVVLFPFSEYWWFYLAFVGLVLLLLSLDLGVFHRKAHAVSFRESAIWSAVWIALALLFNLALYKGVVAIGAGPLLAQALCVPLVAVFSFLLFKLHVFKDRQG